MSEELEATLTLKDRINFPYLLANQILTFQKALLALEFSDREIRETIEGFVHMIPASWKDDQFEKELEESIITIDVDTRPTFCGVPGSDEFCKEMDIKTKEKREAFDPYKRFQAVINLLDRRGMTTKREYTERFTGRRYKDGDSKL